MSTTQQQTEHYDGRELIKPYTTKELAALYEVTPRTFRTWIFPHKEAIGEKISIYYTIKQVEIIFDRLGVPR